MSSIFKWAEIALTNTPLRYDVLSEYLNGKGYKNEVSYIETSPAEFEETLKEVLEKYDAIKLASPYGLHVIKLFQYQPAEIIHINAADSIVKDSEGRWTLSSFNLEGLRRVIQINGPNINLEASVLIVGSGAAARFSISALSKVGLKHFKISNQFQEQAKELIAELEKKFFDSKFEFIPEDQLVLLPGTNSVLVNTTPLVESNSILKELYYFNFLQPEGLVIDFTFLPLTTPLIKEAEQIGIHTVRGYQISGWGDIQWAKHCLNANLDFEEYSSKLLEAGTKWENENSRKEDQPENKEKASPKF